MNLTASRIKHEHTVILISPSKKSRGLNKKCTCSVSPFLYFGVFLKSKSHRKPDAPHEKPTIIVFSTIYMDQSVGFRQHLNHNFAPK